MQQFVLPAARLSVAPPPQPPLNSNKSNNGSVSNDIFPLLTIKVVILQYASPPAVVTKNKIIYYIIMTDLTNSIGLIKQYMPTTSVIADLACFFSVFSDATRVRMIIALAMGEMCVNELVEALELNQSTVSHQLRLLRNAKIVEAKRNGKNIYYSLANKSIDEIMNIGAKNI